MKLKTAYRSILKAVLSGHYTSYDLKEFVGLCYKLALPLLRKKLKAGKLNPLKLGMSEGELVYDCLADLFERDTNGSFVHIQKFFGKESINADSASDELLVDTLRRIVFGVVTMNVIRLYRDADPTLAKILHNIDVAVSRGNSIKKIVRFGETYLIPINADMQLQLPPMPFDYLREQFSRVVLIHDPMPVLLEKLCRVVCEQTSYQRAVSVVSLGLLCKEVYALATEDVQAATAAPEIGLEREEIQQSILRVCRNLQSELRKEYVGKGKKTEEVFNKYIEALQHVLEDGSSKSVSGNKSLYRYLREQLPDLKKEEYMKSHRAVMEYVVRVAKQRLKQEIGRF